MKYFTSRKRNALGSEENVNIYKNLRKRLYSFSYFIQSNNRVSKYVFTILLLFDLFVVILIPIETIFDFDRNLQIKNYKYDKFNIFYLLEQQDILFSIADAINCYLLIVIAGTIFYYC